MAPKKNPPEQAPVVLDIEELEMESIDVYLEGRTALFVNRMTAKAKSTLLIGGRKKTAADKAVIKHNPLEEFVESMYVQEGFHEHSHVLFPSLAVKGAMSTAALATPGVFKTDVSRLVFMPSEHIPIFGVPRLRMDVARMADAKRTPDIRTRAYFPRWATVVRIEYATVSLSRTSVLNLLTNGGLIAGIGDQRQERGKGNFGTFRVANEIPKDMLDGGAQWDAIQNPVPANQETAELLAIVEAEEARRR